MARRQECLISQCVIVDIAVSDTFLPQPRHMRNNLGSGVPSALANPARFRAEVPHDVWILGTWTWMKFVSRVIETRSVAIEDANSCDLTFSAEFSQAEEARNASR